MQKKPVDIGSLIPLGWREWVGFPDWDIDFIKAKVDTGAQTSSLHAEDIRIYQHGEKKMVEFRLLPWQRCPDDSRTVTAELLTFRNIRSSSGCLERRPVIRTAILVGGQHFETELTLTNRQLMGFRMLLGRRSIDRRFLIVTGQSYLGTAPPEKNRLTESGGDN